MVLAKQRKLHSVYPIFPGISTSNLRYLRGTTANDEPGLSNNLEFLDLFDNPVSSNSPGAPPAGKSKTPPCWAGLQVKWSG